MREKKKKLTMRDGSCQMRDNRRLMDEILKKKRKRKLGSAHLLLRNKFNVVAQLARNVDAHLLLKLNKKNSEILIRQTLLFFAA